MKFREWLNQQKERKDTIGKLARALSDVELKHLRSRRRKPDEHKKWANIVTLHGEPEHIRAFNRAWVEYEAVVEDQAPDASA